MVMKALEGIMALTYTPFNSDFTLNEKTVRQEIDWVIDQGATGIWPGGFAGQWPEMDESTRKRHLQLCIDHAGGRVFCAAGCHATNTLMSIRLANFAEKIGYDCAWISPPVPRRATDEEVFEHHRMIIEETEIPIALYDSSPVGTYMSPSLIKDIAALSDRWIAMKAIVSDICHIAGLYHLGLGEKIGIFGVEWNMLPHLQLGAPGAMGGSDWIPIMKAVYDAFQAGDLDKAWYLQQVIISQSPLLIPRTAAMAMGSRVDHSVVGYMKAKFYCISGIDLGPPLPPYKAATEMEREKARKAVAELNRVLEAKG
jgi:4-hydroxy-tetrahydrodipicolinate synthase